MKKTVTNLKIKILANFLLFLILFNVISPTVYGFITDMNGNSKFGVISGSLSTYGHELHYANYEGETYIVFCTQKGVQSPTGKEYQYGVDFEIAKNDAQYNDIAEMIYFGYTSKHGYGLPTNLQAQRDACATQEYVWEARGAGNNRDTWNSNYMSSSIYASWLAETNARKNTYYGSISFDGTTEKINVGDTKTITDTNGILSHYETFTKTENGITFSHIQGSNDLAISTNSNSASVTNFYSRNYGIHELLPNGSHYNNETMSSFICINFGSSTTQNLIFSNKVDPVDFAINVNVISCNLKIKGLNKLGNPVQGKKYAVYTDSNCTNKVYEGTTNENGELILNKIKVGTYYVKETAVPNGYLLDNSVQTVNVTQDTTATIEFNNIEPTGKIIINKTNNVGNKLQGAEFQIIANENIQNVAKTKTYYTKGQVVKTATTNEQGTIEVADLPLGNYIVKETKAPTGYLLNTTAYSANLKYKDNNTSVVTFTLNEVVDEEPTGTINIIKQDVETGSISQGDATFEGAVYEVYASEDIYNKMGTKKFYSKDDLVATRTMKADGTTNDISGLPLGKYYVKEKIAPKGYLIDNSTYNVALSYKDQFTSVITDSVTSKDKVKKRQVNLFKSGIKELSGLVPGLEGATFTIKLNSNVEKALAQGYSYVEIWNGIDEYGNKVTVNPTRVEEAQKIAPTVETITTGSDGNAYTKNMLPYGKYIVKETVTPQDYESAVDFTFSITQDDSEIKENSKKTLRLVVNNEQLETYIKLVKKDKKTGKVVTLNSTSFKIKASEDIVDRATMNVIWHKGEYITQKIGKTTYDTFTTNSKNLIISEKKHTFSSVFDDLGTVTTPLTLPVGSYEIEETEVPEGFLDLAEPIKFEIKRIRDYDTDQDGDFIKEVAILNEQPTGTINLTKTIVSRGEEESDKCLLDTSDLSSIEFKLTAKGKIKDKADDSVIYKAGEVIGTYNVSKEGKLTIDNLPMGTYILEETKTMDGLVVNKEPVEITFTKQDQTTRVYTQNINVENKTTLVEIYKVDKDSKEQLQGAKFALYDNDGNEVDSWISDGTPYIIEGLSIYKEYTLKELEAPKGYYLLDNDFTFNVADDVGLQKIEVKNEKVLKNIVINKKDFDTDNTIIKDFAFGIFSDNECTKLIYEVKPNKGTVTFNNLKIGTYYIKETKAPEYYKLSDKVLKVEIKADKNNGIIIDEKVQKEENYTTIINFTNEVEKGKIEINKVDLDDNNIKLEGIEFKILDIKGKFVEKLVTDKEGKVISSDLRTDTDYVLFETKTKEGYVLNNKTITFRVKANKTTEIKVENERIKSTIEIRKVSADDSDITKNAKGQGLRKTYFNIYDEKHNLIKENLETDENGKITLVLSYGKYYVKEVRPPEFYLLDSNFENNETSFEVRKNGEFIPITFENPSVKLGLDIEKEGLIQTQANDEIIYNFTQLKNNSNVAVDNFTWRDHLPTDYVRITKFYTGIYSEDLDYEVYYKTNKSAEYIKYDNKETDDGKFNTKQNHFLDFSDLNSNEEYVTDFELRFGTVNAGFEAIDKPFIFTKVNDTVHNNDKWINYTYLSGTYISIDGKTIVLEDESKWETSAYSFSLTTKNNISVLPKTGF